MNICLYYIILWWLWLMIVLKTAFQWSCACKKPVISKLSIFNEKKNSVNYKKSVQNFSKPRVSQSNILPLAKKTPNSLHMLEWKILYLPRKRKRPLDLMAIEYYVHSLSILCSFNWQGFSIHSTCNPSLVMPSQFGVNFWCFPPRSPSPHSPIQYLNFLVVNQTLVMVFLIYIGLWCYLWNSEYAIQFVCSYSPVGIVTE